MKKKIIVFYAIALILLIAGIAFDSEIASYLSQNRTIFFNELMSWFSFLGTWFIVLIFMTSLFMWQENKRKWIFPLWCSLIISMAITYFLKLIIMRARPEVALHSLLSSGFSSSFPSGHATAVFSTLAILDKEFPRFKWFWLTFAIIVVFSRLYLGMHYLTDVVIGAVIGYSISLLVVRYVSARKAVKK